MASAPFYRKVDVYMAITAYFYQFEKKVNSTKQPITPIVGDFAVSVELKNVTNLFTPTLVISADRFKNGNDFKNPMRFTYCHIPDFERYYFIRTWSWILGRWECSLEVDTLASFKTEIGNTTAYVLRSASAYDNRIIDTKYTTKGIVKTLSSSSSSIWKTNLSSASINDGFFVIGIVNNDTGAIGATSYYAVNARGMRRFMSELYASPAWMNITDASISNDLQKMLMNPIQYIVSCQWIPYTLLDSSNLTQTTTIPVGWWNITINSNDPFYKLTGATLKETFYSYLDLVTHPQATGAYEWLKNSPYSVYQVRFFPFGIFPIDAAKLVGYDRIYFKIDLDLVTGVGTLTVTRAIGNTDYFTDILYSSNAQVGIPITLAQMSVDMSRLSSGATWALSAGLALVSDTQATSDLVNSTKEFVGAAIPDFGNTYDDYMYKLGEWYGNGRKGTKPTIGGSIITDDYKEAVSSSGLSLLSSAAKVAVNIGNAVLASSGTCQTVGTTGALAQYTLDQTLTLFYYEIVDTDPAHYGYPLSQNRKINTLSGFVMTANEGDLNVSATPVERQAIIAAMTAGFYYE